MLVLLAITTLLAAGSLLVLGFILYTYGREQHRSQSPSYYNTRSDPPPCVCCQHTALHMADGQQVRTWIGLPNGTIV